MTTLQTLAGGDAALTGTRRMLAISCVLAALVLVVLDAAIANVALPAIAHSLHVSPAASVRVVTAYQMALVMTLLPCAALGESLGYRVVYTAGVALFVLGSALCAFAPSLSFLVAARFVQGLGGAAIMSLGVALLRLIVPQRQLGAAIGWNTLAVALASAAGPTLGAVVLSSTSWPWLFAINVPLGALVLAATRALPDVPGTGRRLDVGSVALNGAFFAALVLGAELWRERAVAAVALFAAAGFAVFSLVRREMPKEAPIIPLDLLRERSFRVSVIASISSFVGQSAAMVSLPFYLQHALGQDVLRTGLLMTPWPLTVALVAPIAGRLANRVSGAVMCAAGGALLALGLACAALLPLRVMPLALIPCVALCGFGFGLFQVSNNRNMFLAAPRARSGAAGGMQGTARLTGQTLGALTVSALLTLLPLDVAPRIAIGLAAVLTLVAGLISLLRATTESNEQGSPVHVRPIVQPADTTAAAPRPVRHGLTALLLDLLSALAFALVFALTGRLLLATAGAIAIALVQTVLALVRKRSTSPMQWLALGLAIGLGFLTVITADSRFVRLKPSIAHAAVGALMLKRGWLIPYLPPVLRESLPERMLVGWGYAWAALMFALSAANLAAAQYLSVKAWGLFVTGLFASKLVLFGLQYAVMRTTVIRKRSTQPMLR